jgi:hypothetical protein
MNRMLHIARVENELGTLTDHEALEMLEAGFLSPDDLYRAEGSSNWKPLAELTFKATAQPTSALRRAQQKLAATGGAAVSQAVQFTQKLKSAVARGKDHLTDSTRGMLDSYTPQIRKLVENQLVQRSVTNAKSALHDDEFMRKVFGATYDCLPKPIHRFVAEQAFIEFCLERRQRLLALATTGTDES